MAQKQYEGFTRQTKVIKNSSLTLSTYPTVKWHPNNSYEYMADDSFVKLNLYEKEKGLNVYFNISLGSLKNLHKEIQARYIVPGMPYQRTFTKVYGNYPKPEAQYQAACQTARVKYSPPSGGDLCSDCRKLLITYSPTMPDGSIANNPWYLKIQNGMARVKRGKVAGSYYEGGGSFAVLAENSIRLTQELFDDLISAQTDFFADILLRAKNGELEHMGVDGMIKRMAAIEEYTKRSDYYDTEPPQAVSNSSLQNENSTGNSNAIRFEAVISSEFVRDGNEWKVQALCNGKIYTLYFEALPGNQEVPEELVRSQKSQTPCAVVGWQDQQGKIHARLAA